MMMANATGCSSIWPAAAPSMSYAKNAEGKGPAWSNSLFEDSAEFGLGLYLGVKQVRNGIAELAKEAMTQDIPQEIKDSRAAELMDIQQVVSLGLSNRLIGKKLRVLVDREEADCFAGRTEFDSPEVDGEVLIEKSPDIRVGNFCEVIITGATEFDLYGTLEKETGRG